MMELLASVLSGLNFGASGSFHSKIFQWFRKHNGFGEGGGGGGRRYRVTPSHVFAVFSVCDWQAARITYCKQIPTVKKAALITTSTPMVGASSTFLDPGA